MQLPTEIVISKFKTQPVAESLKIQCKQKLMQLYHIFRQHKIQMKVPTISFDLRGKTAGQAYLQKHHIQLNAVLLNENPSTFLDEIIGHELAHLAAYQGFKEKGHGTGWKKCMAMIDLPPKRCHSLDTSNSTVLKVYKAICNCVEGHKISSRQLPYLLKGTLRCKVCKVVLLAQDPVLRQKAAGIQQQNSTASTHMQSSALTGNGTRSAPAIPETPSTVIAPTFRQLGYMRFLSTKHKVPISSEALTSTTEASKWISMVLSNVQPA